MILTEKEIGKKIKCYHNGAVILRAVFLRLIWVENGDYMQTWENDGSWEVVEPHTDEKMMKHHPSYHEGNQVCSLCECPENIYRKLRGAPTKPAEPKKGKTIRELIDDKYSETRWPPEQGVSAFKLDLLISVLDEKFKEEK